MDHRHIREDEVASLYVMGKLSAQERTAFEEHFVDCQECLDQIELMEGFSSALRLAPEQGAGMAPVDDFPFRLPSQSMAFWRQPGLIALASLLLAACLLGGFFLSNMYHRGELARLQKTADDWQRRYADESQARAALAKKLANTEGKKPTLMADLQPAPLYFLTVTRGVDEGNSVPADRIVIPRTSPSVALSIEFEKDPALQSYRAQLRNKSGSIVWSADNIPPPTSTALAISLPTQLLTPGDYSLNLDGLASEGRYVPTAHMRFRATAQN